MITGILDFRGGTLRPHQVNVTLETTEMVDAAYAIKGTSHISNISRKLYSENIVNTLYADKVDLSLHIPRKATPYFQTSIGNIQWRIRLEFIIQAKGSLIVPMGSDGFFGFTRHIFGEEEAHFQHNHAATSCTVDMFECFIPVVVYGNVGIGPFNQEFVME